MKRQQALKRGVLLSSQEDFASVAIKYQNHDMTARMRLKGDWLDHIRDENKLSFRIELVGEQTLLGMNRFSIQHPSTRNYLYEWFFQKHMKREGLIGLRYGFLDVVLHQRDKNGAIATSHLGIYALEEGFDKLLIESNQRREGVIMKFDERMIWEDRAYAFDAGDGIKFMDEKLQVVGHTSAFALKKLAASANLQKQFYSAKNLLAQYRKDSASVSKVFKTDAVAKFGALCNLYGAIHGMISHNLRFYYDPISSSLEPISFDCEPGHRIEKIIHYYHSENDLYYLERFAAALEEVSKPEYTEKVLDESRDELNKAIKVLQGEFNVLGIDKSILQSNAKMIQKYINPAVAFTAFLEYQSKGKIIVHFKSHTAFPVEIIDLSYKGKRLAVSETKLIRPFKDDYVQFDRLASFDNLLLDKKKKGFDFSKHINEVLVTYRVAGTSTMRTESIVPYRELESGFSNKDIFRKSTNLKDIEFLYVDENSKTITIQSRERKLTKSIVIPPNYQLIASEGLRLDLTDSAMIISRSPINFTGSKTDPVKIFSSDKTGGMVVMESARESVIRYVMFEHLSNPSTSNWSLTGSVNFYEAPVRIEDTEFVSNHCEDALNIIRTKFFMKNVYFRGTYADAFDGDFVQGRVTRARFEGCGNDAIDLSGSEVQLDSIEISFAEDKALSIGEKSNGKARHLTIRNSEIAVVSKDLSQLDIDGAKIDECHLGFTAYQKKSEYGPGKINASNINQFRIQTTSLIEDNSILWLNNKLMSTQPQVVDRLYGVEFGKASN